MQVILLLVTTFADAEVDRELLLYRVVKLHRRSFRFPGRNCTPTLLFIKEICPLAICRCGG